MRYTGKKCLMTAILLVIYLLGATGCYLSPAYYSEKEISNYVKKVFGKEYRLADIDTESHEYTFKNAGGFAFTVTTDTHNVYFDASETMFYEKGLYTDYTERVLEYHAAEIRELVNRSGLNADTSDSYYRIYVDDADEFEPLADFISKLDHLLAYSFNNDNIPADMSEYKVNALLLCIYFKDTEISKIRLSSDDGKRMKSGQIYADIEEDYVNCVKAGEIDVEIDKELWDKYPAGVIDTVYIDGEPLNTAEYDLFTLSYQKDTGTYLIINLDPFEIFEDTSYSYKAGPLAYLVNRLGGTYSGIDWNKAAWTVDGVTWQATLHNEKNDQDYLEVSRNGVKLELTDRAVYGSGGGFPDRQYSIEDLELMLDLEIGIDQAIPAAYMEKK